MNYLRKLQKIGKGRGE